MQALRAPWCRRAGGLEREGPAAGDGRERRSLLARANVRAPRAHNASRDCSTAAPRRYKCNNAEADCAKKAPWLGSDPEFLVLLPPLVQQQFPCLLATRAGSVTRSLLALMRRVAPKSMGLTNLAANLEEARAERYALAEREYYLAASWMEHLGLVRVLS